MSTITLPSELPPEVPVVMPLPPPQTSSDEVRSDEVLSAVKEVDNRRIRAYTKPGGITHVFIVYDDRPCVEIPSEADQKYKKIDEATFDPAFLTAIRAAMHHTQSNAGFSAFVPIRFYTTRINILPCANGRDRIIDGLFRNRETNNKFECKGDFWALFPAVIRLLCYKTYPGRGFYKGKNSIKPEMMVQQLSPYCINTTKGSWRTSFFSAVVEKTPFARSTQNAYSKPMIVPNRVLRHLIHAAMTSPEVPVPEDTYISITKMIKQNNAHFVFRPYDEAVKSLGAWSSTTVMHVNRLLGNSNTGVLHHIGRDFKAGPVVVASTTAGVYTDDSDGGKAPHFETHKTVTAARVEAMIVRMTAANNPSAVSILKAMRGKKRARKPETRRVMRPKIVNGVSIMVPVMVPVVKERRTKRSRKEEAKETESEETESDEDDDEVNPFDNII